METLQAQDDKTSSAVIEFLKDNATFQEFSKKEMEAIVKRDEEDGEKLAAGVQQAIDKGVLPPDQLPPTYEQINVLGKNADQVAEEIMSKLPEGKGCVVILVGLSGTGKGTTVDKIKAKVANASTWSNGNCFRALTLLAALHCEKEGKEGFDVSCLTPENLAAWASMLEFDKFGDKFDIRINGLGVDVKVSEVANTMLKEPRVSKNIPSVAEKTQGEVVKFASEAVKKMGEAGTVVLLEGREQTLNFIPSQYRFCLMMPDNTVIGQRRAAQRIAALTVSRVKEGDDIAAAIQQSLQEIAAS